MDMTGTGKDIPEAAIEAACDLSYAGKQLTKAHARLVLAAALPHLDIPDEAAIRAERADDVEEQAFHVYQLIGEIHGMQRPKCAYGDESIGQVTPARWECGDCDWTYDLEPYQRMTSAQAAALARAIEEATGGR